MNNYLGYEGAVILLIALSNIHCWGHGATSNREEAGSKQSGALNDTDFDDRKHSVHDGAKLPTQGLADNFTDYLRQEDFTQLEQIADNLRKEKARSVGGNWILDYYYQNLALRWAFYGPAREKWLFGVLDRWAKAKPDSVTPLIVIAKAQIDYGWQARGGGWAAEVTQEGWKSFDERLTIAWGLLKKAEQMPVKDPEVYSLFVKAGLGLGKSDEELDYYFNKGVEIEPGYWPLYYERATSLMPRWRGGKGDLEAFMDRAVEITKAKEGTSYYARISDAIFRYYKFDEFQKEYDIPYAKVKQSYWDLLERYPGTKYYLSAFCYYAARSKDKETARILYKRIGNNPDYSACRGKEAFDYYKNWAFDKL